MSTTTEAAVRAAGRPTPMTGMQVSESIPQVLRLLVEDMARTGQPLLVGPGLGSVQTYKFLRGELEVRKQAGIDVTKTGIRVGLGAGVQLRGTMLKRAGDRWIRLERLTDRRERGSCFSRPAPPQGGKDPHTVSPIDSNRFDLSFECGPAELTIPLKVIWVKGRPTVRVEEFHIVTDTASEEKDMYLQNWSMSIKMNRGRPVKVWPSEGPDTGYKMEEEQTGVEVSAEAQFSSSPLVAGIGGSRTKTKHTKEELSLFVTAASLSRARDEVTLVWDTQAWTHDKTVGFHTDTILYRYLSGTSVPRGVSCKLKEHEVGAAFVTASCLSMRENNYRIANFEVQITAQFRVLRRKIAGKYFGFALPKFHSRLYHLTSYYLDEKLSESSFSKPTAGIAG